jgi:hypothetical protein
MILIQLELVQKAVGVTIASMHIVQQAPPAGDLAAVAEVMGKRYHHLQVLTDSTLSAYKRRKSGDLGSRTTTAPSGSSRR